MTKKKRVLLIKPPSLAFKGAIKKSMPPLGLGYLASCLEEEDIPVDIYDATLEGYDNEIEISKGITQYGSTDEEIRNRIKEFNPDIVGIHLSLSIYHSCAMNVAKIVKKLNKNIKVVIGGVHTTFCYKDIESEPNIDYIVLGEGEKAIIKLVNDGSDNKIIVGERVDDLDSIPIPAYHLFDMEGYFKTNLPQNHFPKAERVASIITSRGCPNDCIFCSSMVFFGKKPRLRSVHNIKKEIDYLVKNYNIGEIQFLDDNLTVNRPRSLKIFDMLKKIGLPWCTPNGISVKTINALSLKKMKDSGCYKTTFAIESANDYVRNKIIKKYINIDHARKMIKVTRDIGLELHCYFIIGMPGETYEQMEESFNFIKETKPDSISITLATPLPGTELYKICKENKFIPDDYAFDKIFQVIGNIDTDDFKSDDLEKLQKRKNIELNEFLIKESSYGRDKYDKFKDRHTDIDGKLYGKI